MLNNCQDEAEDTEENLKKDYELKLMHLETKYLREKTEKSSLQNENEKLRQQLQQLAVRDHHFNMLFDQQSQYNGSNRGYSTPDTVIRHDSNISFPLPEQIMTINTNTSCV